jgi:Ca2+-binding EF-hand superfamily protein
MMKTLTLATIITSALASTAIAAQQDADATTPALTDNTFATLDTDKDNFISQGEASKDNVWTYFVKVDEDEDGQLSAREFNTYASIYSKAELPLADSVDINEQSIEKSDGAIADAKNETNLAENELASSSLSQTQQDAISAKAQNSNANVDTQLTEHSSDEAVNENDTLDNAITDAESNVQNALDNAKELSTNEESPSESSAEQQEGLASSDVTISEELENMSPALKSPEQPAPIEQTFAEVDADSNGYISKDEAQDSQISEHFDNADVDSDDKISRQEYDTFVKGQQLTMQYSIRYPNTSE